MRWLWVQTVVVLTGLAFLAASYATEGSGGPYLTYAGIAMVMFLLYPVLRVAQYLQERNGWED